METRNFSTPPPWKTTRNENTMFNNRISAEGALQKYSLHIFQLPVHQIDFTMAQLLHVWFHYNLRKSFFKLELSCSVRVTPQKITLPVCSCMKSLLLITHLWRGVNFISIITSVCVDSYLKYSQLWHILVVKRKQTSKLCKPKCEHGFSDAGVCNSNW